MDPITKIGAAIGSSLAIVLLFSKTVLSVKWWKRYTYTHFESIKSRQDQKHDSTRVLTPQQMISESKTQIQSQSLVQVKLSKWNNNLLNKKVISCEMVEIGHICALENQSMNIMGNDGKYVIPTYYVREYDDKTVLIDTSARYLDRYKVKETT